MSSEYIKVGPNPVAQIIALHPLADKILAPLNLGALHANLMFNVQFSSHQRASELFSLSHHFENFDRELPVPIETGRAAILCQFDSGHYRDILLKGTGLWEPAIVNNQLRDSSRGFTGVLELSEAIRDLVNSELLRHAGISTAIPIAVIDHKVEKDCGGFTERIGNYVRAFTMQTRLSNLTQLGPEARREYIQRTIKILNATRPDQSIQGVRDYFHFMLHKLAKIAAVYQAIGFTQDSLHFGQITLAGEVCDVGIGSFGSIRSYGVVNSLHPWFRHERQPLLLQNMAFKSHSVKSEPRAVQLLATSKTFQKQQSLFGFIKSFDEEAASQILKDNPPKIFWNLYSDYYRKFDSNAFYHEQITRASDFFIWNPREIFDQVDPKKQETLLSFYQEECEKISKVYETQIGPWPKRGLFRQHRKLIFQEEAKKLGIELDLAKTCPGPWTQCLEPSDYFRKKLVNRRRDISEKPINLRVTKAIDRILATFEKQILLFSNLKTVSNIYFQSTFRSILVISKHGMNESEVQQMHEQIKMEFPENLIGVIRPSNLRHVLFRKKNTIFHQYADTFPPRIDILLSRSTSATRLEPLIYLSDEEDMLLTEYKNAAIIDYQGVLGPGMSEELIKKVQAYEKEKPSSGTHPLNIENFSSIGEISNNLLLSGELHNCVSWFITAPIGFDKMPLYTLLGLTLTDLTKLDISDADCFLKYLTNNAPTDRVPLMLLWTDEPLSQAEIVLKKVGFSLC